MNKNGLKQTAKDLELAYLKLANPSDDITDVYSQLLPYIRAAKESSLEHPIKESTIPGNYQFVQGCFCGERDFQKSYINFRNELKGGLSCSEKNAIDIIRSFRKE